MDGFQKPEDIKSIEALEDEIRKVFLIVDEGVVKIVAALAIAARMELDPLWVMLIAPSSGGKTELIQTLGGLPYIHTISDLTVNTFASGLKRTGKETSLLLKIQNGVLAFKDFTSILAKSKETKGEILKQLREIYDGHYVKETGTGDSVNWKGKIFSIAGSTEAIYRHLEEFSIMGDRFVMYSIIQPDRLEMARRMLSNAHDMAQKREHLKQCMKYFVEHVLNALKSESISSEVELDEETKEELLEVADFATRVRSSVQVDFKTGLVDFVPSQEMPTRVTAQLYGFASAFIAMNRAAEDIRIDHKTHPSTKGQLTPEEKKILYKIAFDSIPRTRRDVLRLIAQYEGGVSTAGAATKMGLPSSSVSKYLAQINALRICQRIKRGGTQGDYWKIEEKYRAIVLKLEDMKSQEGTLEGDNIDEESFDDVWDQADSARKEKEMDSLSVQDDFDLK